MTNHSHRDRLSVTKAVCQLDFYLSALGVQFTVQDLYESAYRNRRGARYDDRWLATLTESADIATALEEPFTTHTIVDTLMRTGHEPLVRALMKEIRKTGITFTQAYLIAAPRHRS